MISQILWESAQAALVCFIVLLALYALAGPATDEETEAEIEEETAPKEEPKKETEEEEEEERDFDEAC